MADIDQDQVLGTTVGERLKAAREEKGIALDEIAAQTRIPIRHLEHIERGDWEALPAVTYSIGFARSYANAVGLDGPAIGAELREQLGGGPRTAAAAPAYYEPADPSRVPPRSLALIAAGIALLLAIAYMVWRSGAVEDTAVDESRIVEAGAATPGSQPAPPAVGTPAAATATGPVVLTATSDVWLRVYEGNGGPVLLERTLQAGERYEVPAGARAPQIRTGLPEGLRITVGSTVIPPLAPPATTVANVSLLPADLIARTSSTAAPAAAAGAPPPG